MVLFSKHSHTWSKPSRSNQATSSPDSVQRWSQRQWKETRPSLCNETRRCSCFQWPSRTAAETWWWRYVPARRAQTPPHAWQECVHASSARTWRERWRGAVCYRRDAACHRSRTTDTHRCMYSWSWQARYRRRQTAVVSSSQTQTAVGC